MFKRKKIYSLLTAFCLSAAVLSGCAGNEKGKETDGQNLSTSSVQTESQSTAGAQTGDAVEIRFAWWGGDARHEATLKAIEAYKEIAPNVTIVPEYQGWDGYEDKMATQLAGKTQPDIMQVGYTTIMSWGEKFDCFLDFKSQDTLDLGLFDENFINNFGTYADGRTIAVPAGISSYNLVVNKTVTDAVGIAVPEQMTWEEFIETGKKVHEANPDYYMITSNDDNWNHMLRSYIRQMSGRWSIEDDYTVIQDKEVLVSAFTFLQTLFKEGVAEPMETAYPYYANIAENKKWLSNEIACFYCASSAIGNIKADGMNLDVVSIPIADEAKKTGVITMPSQMFAVTDNEKSVEALKFLEFLYSDQTAVEILKDCRGVPAAGVARDLLARKDMLDPVINKAVNIALENTDAPPSVLSENAEIYGVLFPLMQELCYEAITPEDAADRMIEECQAILDEKKK